MPLTRFFRGIFLSTLSLRRATAFHTLPLDNITFLSTLSLRRATPRRPRRLKSRRCISIHALLAESDRHWQVGQNRLRQFLSTLSLRRATCSLRQLQLALCHFYPRSPCGERRLPTALRTPHHNFYPRSPCGERR